MVIESDMRNTYVMHTSDSIAFTLHKTEFQYDRQDKTNLPRICDLGGTEIQRNKMQICIKKDGWTDEQKLSDSRRPTERERERDKERATVIHRQPG